MTCTITGTAGLPSGAVYPSAVFTFTRLPKAVQAQNSMVVAPSSVTVTSDGTGAVNFDMLAGLYAGEVDGIRFPFSVPDTATAAFQDCVSSLATAPWPDAVQAAIEARTGAEAAEDAAALSAAGAAATLAAHSAFGLTLDGSANAAAARTTLGLGALAVQNTATASQISDSTTAGRALLTAADATAQRTALGGVATLTGTETLTNKSLTSPTLTGAPRANGLTDIGRGQLLDDLNAPQVFASRAAATNSTTGRTGSATEIGVQSGGQILWYYFDAAGDALTTGDGRKWYPLGQKQLEHYNVMGDGATNDRAGWNTAVGYSAAISRSVSAMQRYLLTGANLTIQAHTTVRGGRINTGTTDRPSWLTSPSTLQIDPVYPVTLANGSGIENVAIIRNGLTLSSVTVGGVPTQMISGTDRAAYTGTAVDFGAANGFVKACTLVGFEYGVTSTGTNTPSIRLNDVVIDCTNGVLIDQDLGGSELNRVFVIPFMSSGDENARMPGVGIEMTTRNDGAVLTDCFTYTDSGFKFTDISGIRMKGCSSDGPRGDANATPAVVGSEGIGMQLLGNSCESSFENYRAASHRGGVYINAAPSDTSTSAANHFLNLDLQQNRDYGMLVNKGTAYVIGGLCARSPTSYQLSTDLGQGLVADGAGAIIHVDNFHFSNLKVALRAINGGIIYYGPNVVFDSGVTLQMDGDCRPANLPLTGDVTKSANSSATTLATVNSNVGTFGSATQAAQVTVNAKGLITAAANVTVTPAFASLTGKPTSLSGYGITDAQQLDSDLTTIAALTATTDSFLQSKAGAWSARTPAQVSADLSATIAPTFANITGKPTTLGGYGITDAQPLRLFKTNSGLKPRFFPVTINPGSGALAMAQDLIWLYPVIVPPGYQPDTLEWEVTVGAAGNMRAGVYAHDASTNGPGALLQDSGDVSVSATGIKTMTLTTPLSVLGGVFWTAFIASIGITLRSGTAMNNNVMGGTGLTASAAAYVKSQVYGALPSSFAAVTLGLSGQLVLSSLYKA